MEKKYRYMVIGAHPDDCEQVGGICLKLIKLGCCVKFLTVTNGYSGHHEVMGEAITRRRMEEARRVSGLFGLEYEILDNNDAYLVAGIEERKMIIRAIREWRPDFIFTHRPNDYHPDHRCTSVLVQDSSYLVQVPNLCPTVPSLRYQPIIAYMPDKFKKPTPFEPTMAFDITDVFERKMRMYHQYTSQFYEWLPWVDGFLDQVPEGDEERFEWLLKSKWAELLSKPGDGWDELLGLRYGGQAGAIRYAEAFELCEYGHIPTQETLDEMFPF